MKVCIFTVCAFLLRRKWRKGQEYVLTIALATVAKVALGCWKVFKLSVLLLAYRL
jgi:hypothetical protein